MFLCVYTEAEETQSAQETKKLVTSNTPVQDTSARQRF
jgi:hypothetical protein